MSKQIKMQPSENPTLPTINHKIQPLKQKFFTFQSMYDYGENYGPIVTKILVKNPKWSHLNLKLSHTGEYLKLQKLQKAKSLRLRSIHLECYQLDSQACGDSIHRYFGELDPFTRSGQTLKKLSLSVKNSEEHHEFSAFSASQERRPEVYDRLEKFVKKQKYLDEFGIYMGSQGDSYWMSDLLLFMEKTVKTLTIQNLIIENIFKRYEFPKLETLRFEYMQFYGSEDYFDFSVLRKSLKDILALPSMSALVFSQYQRYPLHYVQPGFEFDPPRPKERLELVPKFWAELRTELNRFKDKPLKIKYHKMDDESEKENVEKFKKIFKELPPNQTFEYEVALPHEELKSLGYDVPVSVCKEINKDKGLKGTRYLISLDKVEPF